MNLAKELSQLLDAWSCGEINERRVHEKAELILENLDDWRELPKTDPVSASYEVLCQLDILNHQWITAVDIPILKEFLSVAEKDPESAWQTYTSHWDSVDYEARREALRGNPNYSA